MKTKFGLAVTLLAFAGGQALAAGTVTAEKNCNVRIEGGDYREGDKVLVFRESGSKRQRLAIVQISKRTNDGKALGRVVQGPRMCAGLKGASAESFGGKGGSASSSGGSLPKLDAHAGLGFTVLSQKGLLVGTPGQQFAENPASLKAVGLVLQADVYPMAFMGNGFIHRSLGVGLSFGYDSVFPKSDVPPKDDPNGEKVGTLSTSLSALEADLIFRFAYLDDKMTTELRAAVYLSHNVTHKYAGEAEGTDSLPITNLSTSGMGVALRQRFVVMPGLRVNAGFLFPFGLKGTASYVSGGTSASLGATSGYYADVSADYFLDQLKFWGGLSYGSFGGSLTAFNPELGIDETFKLEDSRFVISAGAGFHL